MGLGLRIDKPPDAPDFSLVPLVPPSADELLDAVYTQLEFDRGVLFPALIEPKEEIISPSDWIEKGDWLKLAADVGAEKILFIGGNPVVVFAKLGNKGDQTFRKLYHRIWSMARPPLLFLARPGELAVYDLAKPPPKKSEKPDDNNRRISEVVSVLAEVQTALHEFHRERIETGAVFGDQRFGDNRNRADRALIRDLKIVREELAAVSAKGQGTRRPTTSQLHALLGRCIFVRYLEDREIILPAYFEEIAERRQRWKEILEAPHPGASLEPEMRDVLFLRVLRDHDFAYALFDKIAEDFNGDAFPVENGERESIHSEHLRMLRGFLSGQTSSSHGDLFFHAYRFDVVPIELISAIYEEFFNEEVGKAQNQGSHYTPPALAEYVINHTITPEILDTEPRVIDPACGSGIFLVEAYRRMIRHSWARHRKVPSRETLHKLMRDKIAGVDLNGEAIRVAAFSLYLAMLHYQDPRDIRKQPRQPHLKWVPVAERNREKGSSEYFDVLLAANAFEAFENDDLRDRFGPDCADVCVGNPPWGYPKKEDEVGTAALKGTLAWCEKNGHTIGDKELSQAFVHLSLALLRDGGRTGMLLSSGLLFKQHDNSSAFRRSWLTTSRLEHITNFSHLRDIFFSGQQRKAKGIAPFISAVFEKSNGPDPDWSFDYWAAKYSDTIENTQCVVLNRGDMHRLAQTECLRNERLWKIYWWGNHRDEALIRKLISYPSALSLANSGGCPYNSGGGLKVASNRHKVEWPKEMKFLPTNAFTRRYGDLELNNLPPRRRRWNGKESGMCMKGRVCS